MHSQRLKREEKTVVISLPLKLEFSSRTLLSRIDVWKKHSWRRRLAVVQSQRKVLIMIVIQRIASLAASCWSLRWTMKVHCSTSQRFRKPTATFSLQLKLTLRWRGISSLRCTLLLKESTLGKNLSNTLIIHQFSQYMRAWTNPRINLRCHQGTNTSGFLTDRELENLRSWSFYPKGALFHFSRESISS